MYKEYKADKCNAEITELENPQMLGGAIVEHHITYVSI